MKIYIQNISKQKVGGGWTWLRNFRKSMQRYDVQFVDNWKDCDVFLIAGVTITDPYEVIEAKKAGKAIVHRVDNVPRKSRNRRNTPHERMKELSDLSDVIIYQSNWARTYCKPLCGDGTVIYNGVDKDIFYPPKKLGTNHKGISNRYLFAYNGKSELKQFWVAHYLYQMEFRESNTCDFWFIYDFGRDLEELKNGNFDFWNGERYSHIPKVDDPNDMADIMRQCETLIFPSVADASPNTVLEARACGLKVIGYPNEDISGTKELLDPNLDISLDRMGEEYWGVLQLACQKI